MRPAAGARASGLQFTSATSCTLVLLFAITLAGASGYANGERCRSAKGGQPSRVRDLQLKCAGLAPGPETEPRPSSRAASRAISAQQYACLFASLLVPLPCSAWREDIPSRHLDSPAGWIQMA